MNRTLRIFIATICILPSIGLANEVPKIISSISSVCKINGDAVNTFFSDKSNGWLGSGFVLKEQSSFLNTSNGNTELANTHIDIDSDGVCEILAHHPNEKKDGDGSAVGLKTKRIVYKYQNKSFYPVGEISGYNIYLSQGHNKSYNLVALFPSFDNRLFILEVYEYKNKQFNMVFSKERSFEQGNNLLD